MRRVCVFCGASAGNDPAYAALARSVGEGLARRGIGLVYGGGRVGLMGVAADAADVPPELDAGTLNRTLVEVHNLTLNDVRLLDILDKSATGSARMGDLADGLMSLPSRGTFWWMSTGAPKAKSDAMPALRRQAAAWYANMPPCE